MTATYTLDKQPICDLYITRLTYIKIVEGIGELSGTSWLVQGRLLQGIGLGSIGDSRNGMLQLLEDQVTVGLVGCHIRMLQAGTGCRVQHGDIPLQHPACCGHLVLVMDVLELLGG